MAARAKRTQGHGSVPRRIKGGQHVGTPLEIPMSFEVILFDQLEMQSMLRIHGGSSLASWRGCLRAYFSAMEKGVRDTIAGDSQQRNELMRLCRAASERAAKAKSHGEVLVDATGSLALLCFRMLGGAPRQRGEGRAVRRNWNLGRYRTLTYTRNAEQMAWAILDHARFWRADLPEEIPTSVQLVKKRAHELKMDNDAFVDWFRREFPRAYAAIF
jgi:hypothetical protein